MTHFINIIGTHYRGKGFLLFARKEKTERKYIAVTVNVFVSVYVYVTEAEN